MIALNSAAFSAAEPCDRQPPAEESAPCSPIAPARDARGLSPSMPLSEFFDVYFTPVFLAGGRKADGTIREYEQTLKFWRLLTDDPPLNEIDTLVLTKFFDSFRQRTGKSGRGKLASNTVRKHAIALQAVLDRAGPFRRDSRNSRNAELLERVPLVEKPGIQIKEINDCMTLAEIGQFLDGCDLAKSPRGLNISPCDFWRAMVTVIYNCGPRIGTCMGLRWSWLEKDEHAQWFAIPSIADSCIGTSANKSKRHFKMYVNRHASAALQIVRGCWEGRSPRIDPDFVFPWLGTPKALQVMRRRILAGLDIVPARQEILGFHSVRKAAATAISQINPAATAAFLGHRTRDIALNHYVDKSVLLDAIEKLPQPASAFDRHPQRLLLSERGTAVLWKWERLIDTNDRRRAENPAVSDQEILDAYHWRYPHLPTATLEQLRNARRPSARLRSGMPAASQCDGLTGGSEPTVPETPATVEASPPRPSSEPTTSTASPTTVLLDRHWPQSPIEIIGPQLRIADGLSLPPEAVTQTFAILAKRGVGKTHTATVLAEEMLKLGQQIIVYDPTGAWHGLKKSADGKGPGLPAVVFGGEHADVEIHDPDYSGALIASTIIDQRISAVLDCSLLRGNDRSTFLADFFETVYHGNRSPLHLFLDEAQTIVPQRPKGGAEGTRLSVAVEDCFLQGRRRGIGATIISQRPALVSKAVTTQCEVLIAMRMVGALDRRAIQEWIAVHAEDSQRARAMIASLPSLGIGEGWVWSPGWQDLFHRVKFRLRETLDTSATPTPEMTMLERKPSAPADLAAIAEQLRQAATQKAAGREHSAPNTRKTPPAPVGNGLHAVPGTARHHRRGRPTSPRPAIGDRLPAAPQLDPPSSPPASLQARSIFSRIASAARSAMASIVGRGDASRKPAEGGERRWRDCRITELFEAWFRPLLLRGRTHASEIESFAEAVALWTELGDDLPIRKIDERSIEKYRRGLLTATHRIGLFAGEGLPAEARSHHLLCIRTLLNSCPRD
ncbi:MAG TPA: DUF87 domain-containing protein [Pirellulales bacterium]|jgi:integrase|nr:DUF87 domain-containing protein [Pirellulales bacterium]